MGERKWYRATAKLVPKVKVIQNHLLGKTASDLILVCDDGELKGHRLFLMNCSELLRVILKGHICNKCDRGSFDPTTIILPGVKKDDLTRVLEVIYIGRTTFENKSEYSQFQTLVQDLRIELPRMTLEGRKKVIESQDEEMIFHTSIDLTDEQGQDHEFGEIGTNQRQTETEAVEDNHQAQGEFQEPESQSQLETENEVNCPEEEDQEVGEDETEETQEEEEDAFSHKSILCQVTRTTSQEMEEEDKEEEQKDPVQVTKERILTKSECLTRIQEIVSETTIQDEFRSMCSVCGFIMAATPENGTARSLSHLISFHREVRDRIGDLPPEVFCEVKNLLQDFLASSTSTATSTQRATFACHHCPETFYLKRSLLRHLASTVYASDLKATAWRYSRPSASGEGHECRLCRATFKNSLTSVCFIVHIGVKHGLMANLMSKNDRRSLGLKRRKIVLLGHEAEDLREEVSLSLKDGVAKKTIKVILPERQKNDFENEESTEPQPEQEDTPEHSPPSSKDVDKNGNELNDDDDEALQSKNKFTPECQVTPAPIMADQEEGFSEDILKMVSQTMAKFEGENHFECSICARIVLTVPESKTESCLVHLTSFHPEAIPAKIRFEVECILLTFLEDEEVKSPTIPQTTTFICHHCPMTFELKEPFLRHLATTVYANDLRQMSASLSQPSYTTPTHYCCKLCSLKFNATTFDLDFLFHIAVKHGLLANFIPEKLCRSLGLPDYVPVPKDEEASGGQGQAERRDLETAQERNFENKLSESGHREEKEDMHVKHSEQEDTVTGENVNAAAEGTSGTTATGGSKGPEDNDLQDDLDLDASVVYPMDVNPEMTCHLCWHQSVNLYCLRVHYVSHVRSELLIFMRDRGMTLNKGDTRCREPGCELPPLKNRHGLIQHFALTHRKLALFIPLSAAQQIGF